MPQKIEKSFDVPLGNGRIKKVQLVYDLTFYSEKKYKKDFDDFVAYQTRKENIQSPGDQDLIYYRLKSYPYIPYEQFLTSVGELFSKIILQVLTDNPSIMVSDDEHFKVTLILYRVLGRDWYFDADPNGTLKNKHPEFIRDLESETVENISYLVAGVYLINSIAAPWFYLKKIPSSFVYRYLMHEFEHHEQYMMDSFRLSEKIEERLKGRVGKYPNYRATFLFLAMYELLEEGTADFATIANRPRMDIRMDAILQFREDLNTLVTIVGKRKAEEFYEKNFSYGTLTKGSYYCGKVMCFTIELA
ncbi:MAG TPA: hypothetical protein VJB12_05370, partial [Candidatus Nanoarchaeia archaeon]|nr:hypothetical protein [Candidatus Nanoarchaeia archaeon]